MFLFIKFLLNLKDVLIYPPNLAILEICVFDISILADKLFAKFLQNIAACLSVCSHIWWQSQVTFVEFFVADLNFY